MIPAVWLPELPGQQDRRRWAELSLSSPCREQGSVLRTRPSPHSLPLLLPSPPSRALPGLSNPSMMETRYNPVSQSVYPTSLPHARTGERERERERAVRFESVRQWKGRDREGTGEEDTAPLLTVSPPPPSPPPPLHHPPSHRDRISVVLQPCKPPLQWGAGWQWLPWSDCCSG